MNNDYLRPYLLHHNALPKVAIELIKILLLYIMKTAVTYGYHFKI